MHATTPPTSPRLGAHVSVAGGILNAPRNAVEATCEAFQMWVSSPRAWRLPTVEPDMDKRFRQLVTDAGLDPVFVHAPYLVSFASPNDPTFDQSVRLVAATLDKAAAIGAAGSSSTPAPTSAPAATPASPAPAGRHAPARPARPHRRPYRWPDTP